MSTFSIRACKSPLLSCRYSRLSCLHTQLLALVNDRLPPPVPITITRDGISNGHTVLLTLQSLGSLVCSYLHEQNITYTEQSCTVLLIVLIVGCFILVSRKAFDREVLDDDR